MINFIVGEDNVNDRKLAHKVITKYMMKNEIDYKIHLYDDYNREFIKMVNKKLPFKIYILDIETPSGSGIDMARIIRNKDIDSVIIFLTGHDDLSNIVAKNDFLFLTFINKFDNCEKRLTEALNKALQVVHAKKTIRFKDSGVVYKINLDDILYVIKESVERKCIIKTDYAEYRIGKNLSEVISMLNGNFVKTHRACVVNTKRVTSYNKPKRLVTFDNGEKIDIVSTRFEGELI
ncbi:MAG: response regulator [Bacilli bacterium]|nr:response regulator [Bacilli bacterium]